MRCAILLKSKVTCDQLKKVASFLNTSGHDISDVFEPASDPLVRTEIISKNKRTPNEVSGLYVELVDT